MQRLTLEGLSTTFVVTAFIIVFTIALNFIFNLFRKLAMKFQNGYKFINYFTVPGVAFHETSHALFATLLGAKVTKIVFFKKDHSDGTLGYVTYTKRGPKLLQNYQSIFSGIAPNICGFFGTYVMLRFLHPVVWQSHNIIFIVLFYYLLACILLHGTLSDADIKNVRSGLNWKSILILVLALLVFVIISYIFSWAILKPVYFFWTLGRMN